MGSTVFDIAEDAAGGSPVSSPLNQYMHKLMVWKLLKAPPWEESSVNSCGRFHAARKGGLVVPGEIWRLLVPQQYSPKTQFWFEPW